MRLIVTSFGSEGDTRPFLALADGLTSRGHETLVCLDRSGREEADRLGVAYRELAGDMRSHMRGGRGEEALARATSDGGFDGLRLFADFARSYTTPWIATIRTAIREHRPDVVIGSGLTVWAAHAAAEVSVVRFATAGAFPLAPTRAFPSVVSPGVPPAWLNLATHHVATQLMWSAFRRPVDRARRALGLRRFTAIWNDVPAVYGYSPTLLPTPDDWRSNVRVCGDWHLDEPKWVPPQALADFLAAGEPPVYVGFGSMVGTDDVTRTVLDGLGAWEGRRIVLNPGWNGTGIEGLPDSVHVIGPTPHSWLLPRCAAAVHHCGAGTTHAAARAGTPSIPVPFAADQPFWARRLAATGVASEPLDRRRLTVTDVRRAAKQVTRPSIRGRARQIAAEVAREDSVGAVIDHLSTWSTPPAGVCRENSRNKDRSKTRARTAASR